MVYKITEYKLSYILLMHMKNLTFSKFGDAPFIESTWQNNQNHSPKSRYILTKKKKTAYILKGSIKMNVWENVRKLWL